MSLAVPETPLTSSGGVAWPQRSQPQQTTLPVPAWIAQLWAPPAAMWVAVPEMPLTASGGVAWPKSSRPQPTTGPSDAAASAPPTRVRQNSMVEKTRRIGAVRLLIVETLG